MPRGTDGVKGRRAGVPSPGRSPKKKIAKTYPKVGSTKKSAKPSSTKAELPLKNQVIDLKSLSPRERAEVLFDAALQSLRKVSAEAYEKAEKEKRR